MLLRTLAASVVLAALVLAVACSSAQPSGSGPSDSGEPRTDKTSDERNRSEPPEREPDIVGTVTEVDREDPDVLVEEHPDKKEGSSECPRAEISCGIKRYLSIKDETLVFREEGSIVAEGSATKLRRGQEVRVWHVPLVAESYPGHTEATDIEIQGSAGA